MKTNVLIPDGHSIWALSVINCLARQTGIQLFVLSNKKRTATKFSRYTSYYKFYEYVDVASRFEFINNEIENNKIDVVIPIAEDEISFFIKHKAQISQATRIIPLPSLDAFKIAIDKKKLGEFCLSHQLPYPKSWFFQNYTSFNNEKEELTYPVLIKPLSEKGGDGIIKFETEAELNQFLNQNLKSEGYFIQDYINGYDIDCSVLCKDGNILKYTIQKGYLPGDTPYEPHVGVEFLENDEVLHIVKGLIKSLDWSGIAHIDLRYDKNTNDYKIIEVNARFWGSVEASKVAGINFPLETIRQALDQKIEDIPLSYIKYLRLKGLVKFIKEHPGFLFNFNFIANNSEMTSVLLDPLPTLYKFKEWIGRKF